MNIAGLHLKVFAGYQDIVDHGAPHVLSYRAWGIIDIKPSENVGLKRK